MTTKPLSGGKGAGEGTQSEAPEADLVRRAAEYVLDLINAPKTVNLPPISEPEISPEPSKVSVDDVPPARPKKRERRSLQYSSHYSLRMREEDRDRLDNYAHRHRITKGEALQRMLDTVEAVERDQGK